MRKVLIWILATFWTLVAFSVTVAVATVKLMPSSSPTISMPVDSPPATASEAAGETVEIPRPRPASPAPGSPEEVAMELIRLAGKGDLDAALALVKEGALTEADLRRLVQRFSPKPKEAAPLPGNEASKLLVWVDYSLQPDHSARGLYQVTVVEQQVTSLQGVMAPTGGFAPPPWTPLDESGGKPISLKAYQGRPLLLVAPRTPQEGLVEAMITLQQAGLEVVLVIDTASPDWIGTARHLGFHGPVWRLKERLEDAQVVNQGRVLGAIGVLVSPEGLAVGPFAAFDPMRYGLSWSSLPEIALVVMKAYGLAP